MPSADIFDIVGFLWGLPATPPSGNTGGCAEQSYEQASKRNTISGQRGSTGSAQSCSPTAMLDLDLYGPSMELPY